MQIYETERLDLVTSEEMLTLPVLEYYERNRAFLQPYSPVRPPAFYTALGQAEQLSASARQRMQGNELRVWLRPKGELRIIGMAALTGIVRGAFCSCFLSYEVDEQELRKGYATEAVSELIHIAFNELELHRMEANIMPRNKASLALVRKLGFQEEGLARRYLKINGKWEDHVHMALLND